MTIKELEKRPEWKMLVNTSGKEGVLKNLFAKIKPEQRHNLLDELVLLLLKAVNEA